MASISVSEARASLPELLDRIAAGEEVTITRHGKAAAVLVRPEALRVRRADAAFAQAAELRALLDDGRRASLPEAGGLSPDRADELAAEVRAARDRDR